MSCNLSPLILFSPLSADGPITQTITRNKVIKVTGGDCQDIALVLTNFGNIFTFTKQNNVKYNFSLKNILQIHTTSSTGYIIFEDLSIQQLSEESFSSKSITLLDFIYGEKKDGNNTTILQNYLNYYNNYNFSLTGDASLYLIIQKKDKDNLLIEKLKVMSQKNKNDKNYFYDIYINLNNY
ncbi:hypothetical protein ABK040_004909 [Willaertia magna]